MVMCPEFCFCFFLPFFLFSVSYALPLCNFDPTKDGMRQTFSCSGYGNDFLLTLPSFSACPDSIGLIVDMHGYTMSGLMQDANTNTGSYGTERCFIVFHPTANGNPGVSTHWNPKPDHANVIDFIKELIDDPVLRVDKDRIHAMGFSEGGFATWNLLCLAPELFCSIAPLSASGLDVWGNGYGQNCFESTGPATERSIAYFSGVSDPQASIALARQQKQNVLNRYDLPSASEPEQLEGRMEVEYSFDNSSNNDLTFLYVEFDYEGNLYEDQASHCFPTLGVKNDGSSTCNSGRPFYTIAGEDNHQCCAPDFTWSEMAVDFFVEHPCSEITSFSDGDGSASAPNSSGGAERSAKASLLIGAFAVMALIDDDDDDDDM